MTEIFPKIIIIAVYFGKLPEYFPLWLQSCRYNPQIEWRVVTDADLTSHELPANVTSRVMTLQDFTARVASVVSTEINALNPYKVCDIKPLFWTLMEESESCDFWGHCDLDMIFGNISAFLTADILDRHDKIFSVGHLTLYRNKPETNHFFEKPHPDLDYREILADPNHRGFDEHIGVNRIWLRHNGRFYSNEAVVADIDPHIRRFERASNYHHFANSRHQAFLFDRGKVKRLYWSDGALKSEEFMYIHFQKRKFIANSLPADCDRFYITPSGFLPAGDTLPDRAELDRINGRPRLDTQEIRHRLRRLKRRLFHSTLREERAA